MNDTRKIAEFLTFKDLVEKFPTGILSIVSDTFNLWDVCTEFIPRLKKEILARDGKIVIRPDCYSDDTKVLTETGWKLFTDLNPHTDLVAQVLDDGTYEFVRPLKYVNEYYEGEMISYKDQYGKIDLMVTPNHRMIYDNGSGNFQVQEAKDCNFFWKKDIRRSALAQDKGMQLSPKQALKIAFQADGSYTTSSNNIRFSFSKERKMDRLESILKDCKYEYKKYPLKDNRFEYHINVDANDFKKDFSWVNFKNVCSNWCQEFIEELSYWDATRRHENRFKFDTTSREVIEVVELVAMSAGYGVLITESKDDRKDIFSNVFTAHIMKDNKLGGGSIKKNIVQYKGNIVCVQVPTGRLVVKRGRGQLVCGNSGDPVHIICGYSGRYEDIYVDPYSPKGKGVIELLWDIFGGTINEQGYKVLNPKIGAIYGDSITIERAEEICKRLEAKGFASTNVVLGIGSFTYQYNTRDTFGFAMKATYIEVDICEKGCDTSRCKEDICVSGIEGIEIFKDPVTDDGTKKSAKGLLYVNKDKNGYFLVDQVSWNMENKGELITIFEDGKFYNQTTLTEIREKLK